VVRLNIYFQTILDSAALVRSKTYFWNNNNIRDLTQTLLEQRIKFQMAQCKVLGAAPGHWRIEPLFFDK